MDGQKEGPKSVVREKRRRKHVCAHARVWGLCPWGWGSSACRSEHEMMQRRQQELGAAEGGWAVIGEVVGS